MQILKIFAISLLSFILILNVERINASYLSHTTKPVLFSVIAGAVYQHGVHSVYQNYYAVKYRQTRFGNVQSCGKRKRNIQNRRCHRQCKDDTDCRGSKRKCLCDGECGMSCIRTTTICSEVGNFPNGHVTYSPDNHFGSHLMYECEPGFKLIGPKTRRCEGDGWWSEAAPVCSKEVFCGQPPTIINALPNVQINKDAKYKIGTEVEYQCDIGFVKNDASNKVFCQEDQKWSDLRFSCSKIDCLRPPDIENGIINANDYFYSSVIEYRCKAGYRIRNGDYLRECDLDGKWSGREPICEPINCGNPPYVKNSIADYDRTVFGSFAQYTCISKNYIMIGYPRVNCLPNGRWQTDLPSCIEQNCTLEYSEYSKPIYKIFSSSQPLQEYSYPIQTEIRFMCQPGYNLIGQTHATCVLSDDGAAWNVHLPRCELKNYCETLNPPENGQINSVQPLSSNGYPENTTLEISCFTGYRLFGSASLTCNKFGKWLGNKPLCIPELTTTLPTTTVITTTQQMVLNCKLNSAFQLISYANNVGPSTDSSDSDDFVFSNVTSPLNHGSSAIYKCQRNLKNSYMARCSNGTLIMQQNCNSIDVLADQVVEQNANCPPPPPLTNGYHKFSSFMHGSKVYYQCYTGYSIGEGDKILVCSNGKWVGIPPVCSKINCGYPGQLNNGKIMYIGTLDEYQYKPYMTTVGQNKQIRYECDIGYKLIGPTGSTCINGKWKPEFNIVSCVKDVNAVEPEPIHNIAFVAPNYQHQRFIQPEYEAKRNNIISYLSLKKNNQQQSRLLPYNSDRFKRRRRLRRLRKKKLGAENGSKSKFFPNKRRFKQRRMRRRKRPNHFSERKYFSYIKS